MSIAKLLDSAQFLVDGEGNRKAVQLDLAVWEELISLLEDLEDAEELEQAHQEEDEVISWEEVKTKYIANQPNVDI